jgi:two-component system, OmpR family, sensor kinase
VSFRARVVLAAAYLLGAVVLALEIPLALNVDRRATSEFKAAVLGNAALLAASSADQVVAASSDTATDPQQAAARNALRNTVRTSGVTEQGRVIITDGRGALLVDSSGVADLGDAYATPDRPEMEVALGGRVDTRQRRSDSLGEDLVLVTVPVVDKGKVVGAVRVSAPMGDVRSDVRSSWLRLFAIGLAVVSAGLVLAWVLAGQLARPLERLGRAATRLGRGELDTRVEPEGPREIVAVGQSFNQMARALGANLEAQREFIANASHQLRTPLTGIKLRLEAIQAEGGEAGEQAAKAEAEVDRLSSLVDDLLALARASASEASGDAVDVSDVARAAVKRWAGPVGTSGHEIAVVAADPPAVVWTEPADVAQILDNLIENAIRYAPAGSQIMVEALSHDGRVILAVEDNGPGIAPADRPRIFDRFYRGSNGRQAGPGTGLGLPIVLELAERWQGRVSLGEGAGMRVEIDFPQPPAKR